MKKVYNIYIDCAACASELENKLSKINGVNSVSVNFLTQKLTLDFDESNADVLKKVKKTCKRFDGEIKITE